MKRHALSAAFFVMALSGTSGQAATNQHAAAKSKALDPKAVDREIRDITARWKATVLKGDVSVLEKILAEDFVAVDVDGKQEHRADTLAGVTKGPAFTHLKVDHMTVELKGTTAINKGVESYATATGESGAVSFIHTWKLRHGQWQIVHSKWWPVNTKHK